MDILLLVLIMGFVLPVIGAAWKFHQQARGR